MAMTWGELIEKIDAMTSEQLRSVVTIHLHSRDEYYAVDHFELVNDNEEDRLDDGHPFLVVLDGESLRSGKIVSADRADTQNVLLSTSDDGESVFLGLPGYGLATMDNAYNDVIELHLKDGNVILRVWANINDEEATHVIDLSGAKLEKRLPDLNIDDKVWVRLLGSTSTEFRAAHFASWTVDGKSMMVWPYGQTSHTRKSSSPLIVEEWRLTPEAAT